MWSRLTPGHLTSAVLTATGAVLGDDRGLVLFVSEEGEVVAEHPLPAPIHDLAATGEFVAVACGDGEVVLIEKGDVLFREATGHPVTMVALGPLGDYLLAVSPEGKGGFFNRFGREMNPFVSADGVESIAIIPASGSVVCVTRGGTVLGFASWGKPLWRVELRRAAGEIATDHKGELLVIPVMAYGAEAMKADGEAIGAYDIGEPVKAAGVSGDGETILLSTSENRLVLLQTDATVVSADRFPSGIESLEVSDDGTRALVRTSSGYAHLLAVSMRGEGPLLELSENPPAARSQYRLKKTVFSPYSMILRTRLSFSRDSSCLAVAGDRRKVQVLDLDGEQLATRRYGGTLLDVKITPEGDVRVFASQSVFRFRVDEDGSIPEWIGVADLSHVCIAEDGSAVGLTDDGFIVGFKAERGNGERLFPIPHPDVNGFLPCDDGFAVSRKAGVVAVYDREGIALGECGPFSAKPELVAAQDGVGILLSVRKLLILMGPDGEERWRHHLPAPARSGVAVPGAFLVIDEAGTAHIVTPTGIIRPAFAAGNSKIVSYPDAGEGPGFLLTAGNLVTAVGPAGQPRWRFRTPDEISFVRPSPDGRFAGAFAGHDLYVFPLLSEDRADQDSPDAHRYLEFADG
jgi:hypothetical protein